MSKPKIAPPEFYFDARGGGYQMRINGRFLPLDRSSVSLQLRYAGFSEKTFTAQNLNEIEQALVMAQRERAVFYAGPLAGHKVGVFTNGAGDKVLVTSEARTDVFEKPQPAKKTLKHLERFLQELLEEEQYPFFLLWLKFARLALRQGDFRPGQLVVLAGESGCGKSFLQALITEFLGGRGAKPYRYMMGETAFNSDLAGAEHLYIEDEHPSTNIAQRRKFGNAIKELLISTEMSVHAKGRQAITLPTYKRGTLSVNKEAENLMVVPPLDDSILDKVMLFKCSHADLSDERSANWRRMTDELPALAERVDALPCPKELRDSRYGVRAHWNAELLELLADLAPETRLRNFIDQIIFGKHDEGDVMEIWTGSAEELEQRLLRSAFNSQVEKLLTFSSACGTYLARLAAKSQRFEARKAKGKTKWIIRQPAE